MQNIRISDMFIYDFEVMQIQITDNKQLSLLSALTNNKLLLVYGLFETENYNLHAIDATSNSFHPSSCWKLPCSDVAR